MPTFGSSFHKPVYVEVPPELSTETALLAYLGLSAKELELIWWFRARMYHQFEIAKGNSKSRSISAPDVRLKYLQRRIAALLNQIYDVRRPVHGFVPDKSVKTNALEHLKKKFIINIDIKDFFPSITEERVIGVLKAMGLDSRVSTIVARLCCNFGCLPQGAPTSPVLSNLICFRLDKRLLAFAKEARCIYTRYADDITFSSRQPMAGLFDAAIPPTGHFSPDLLAKKLKDIFSANGFLINPDKAHYADKYSRRMVTGLKINELINIDRRFVRNVRAILYSIEILGKEAAQKKFTDITGKSTQIREHLRGKISWLRYIRGQSDPVFRGLAVRFNENFQDHKIDLTPTPDDIRDRAVWIVEKIDDVLQGTAFFLKDFGLVTAAHCVEGVAEVYLYHPSKPANKFKVTIQKIDKHIDLAKLENTIPSYEYYELERSNFVIGNGNKVTALGYPDFGPGDKLNIRTGTVSSLPIKSDVHRIEVTQRLSPGMSGGPLLDIENRVVGVIHKGGALEERDLATYINEIDKI
ncbi:reverse transcriptase domain-containing protein [Halotia wernerae UHCC 0503]|nr:reverse transcriptase domain-containing protein [Halotia wernerae UHCC 0503]